MTRQQRVSYHRNVARRLRRCGSESGRIWANYHYRQALYEIQRIRYEWAVEAYRNGERV